MSSSLLHPPSQLPPAVALQQSQKAPGILANSTGAISSSVFQSLLSAPETPELWTIYENLLLSCLRTRDDESAHSCLARLVNRFGNDNERIIALMGLLKEASANDAATLDAILKEYEQILQDNPTNIVSPSIIIFYSNYINLASLACIETPGSSFTLYWPHFRVRQCSGIASRYLAYGCRILGRAC